MVRTYDREIAVAEGRLIEVSHLNRDEWNPYPTFVSIGLWNACDSEQEKCLADKWHPATKLKILDKDERVRRAISLSELFLWLKEGRRGSFEVHICGAWLRRPILLQVIIAADEDYGTAVYILLPGERLDFDGPWPDNGGSFFVV